MIVSHAHLRFMLDAGNRTGKPLCPIGKHVLSFSPDNGSYSPCMHHT
ncbi:MAG: hypothetical protein ACTSU5_07905 [Promethearchaeota archaeon]